MGLDKPFWAHMVRILPPYSSLRTIAMLLLANPLTSVSTTCVSENVCWTLLGTSLYRMHHTLGCFLDFAAY